MLILVAYDVSTETSEGRRRLRRVARVCQDYGQRVQKSVFECKVDAVNYAVMEQRLLEEIDFTEDNLRFYRLNEPLQEHVKEFGIFKRWTSRDHSSFSANLECRLFGRGVRGERKRVIGNGRINVCIGQRQRMFRLAGRFARTAGITVHTSKVARGQYRPLI